MTPPILSISRYKYPRTPHLPWSQGVSSDDLVLDDFSAFVDQEVVVTEKLDGENTTLYTDHIHARSIDSKHHPSHNWVKQLHGQMAYHIPSGWRFCGENVYARHSITYHNLQSYFYLFSIWNEHNVCLSWKDTQEWAELLNIPTPPVLYQGVWSEDTIRHLSFDPDSTTCWCESGCFSSW